MRILGDSRFVRDCLGVLGYMLEGFLLGRYKGRRVS